jgi:integrase
MVDSRAGAYVLVYDLAHNQLVDELVDYLIWRSRHQQADCKTLLQEAYDLSRFWEYLCELKQLNHHGPLLSRVNDDILRDFRDTQLVSVMNSRKSLGKERSARATVNVRLRRAYNFLFWLADLGQLGPKAVGSHGRVTSTSESRAHSHKRSNQRAPAFALAKYPLLFRRTGAQSKHKFAHVPSEDQRLSLVDQLIARASSPFIAHRNALLIDIANTTGLRRESINSLCVAQFDAETILLSDADYVYVTPAEQKFGYEDRYEFPVALALRVSQFCSNYRAPFLRQHSWSEARAKDKVFLSSRTGRPLTDRALTQLVGAVLQALGAPRGSSLHSLRHKFACDEIRKESEYRVSAGLDTSAASIAASVSLRLGHKNPHSLFAYVSRAQSNSRFKANKD